MKNIMLLLTAALLIMTIPAMGAKVKSVPVVNETQIVFQAYPGSSCVSDRLDGAGCGYVQAVFHGDAGESGDPICASPGILAIDPGDYTWIPDCTLQNDPTQFNDTSTWIFKLTWSNYVKAAYGLNKPYWDYCLPILDPNQEDSYYIKNVRLKKTVPTLGQCYGYLQGGTVQQQGSENIRLWWPLLFEIAGTEWTLTLDYGTRLAFDDDGAGPNGEAWFHTEIWKWRLEASLESMINAIVMFHQLPQGTCQVPLISGDKYWFTTYDQVVAVPDQCCDPIFDDWDDNGSLYLQLIAILEEAIAANGDTWTQSCKLEEFELVVSDNCVYFCPPNGAVAIYPAGPSTNIGIVNTECYPVCCKLLADAEYVAANIGAFQDAK